MVQARVPQEYAEDSTRTEIGERLLQHGIHEENVFYNRLNFFLIFESVLFTALLTAYGSDKQPPPLLMWTVPAVGYATSLFWLVVQYDKLMLVKTLVDRIVEHLPEFGVTIARAQAKGGANIRATEALALIVPYLFILLWIWVVFVLGIGSFE